MVKRGTKNKLIPIAKNNSVNPNNNTLSFPCGETEKLGMVKKGGTKTSIEIKKIQKKSALTVACSKRRGGLFSKTAQLCLLSGAQVAILATPPCSESNIPFYSFGHSSVDGIVSAFLSGQRPVPEDRNKQMAEDVGVCLTRKDLGLGFWWNDEKLDQSTNPKELSDAIDSMSKLLGSLKELNTVNDHPGQSFVDDEDLKKNEKIDDVVVVTQEEPDQTLNLQSTSGVTDNNNNNNEEENLDYNQEMDIDQLVDFDSNFEGVLDDWFSKLTDQELDEANASLLKTSSESIVSDVSNPNLCFDFQGLGGDGDLELHRWFEDVDIPISDMFNDFATIPAF